MKDSRKREHGFSTPVDYFTSIEEQLISSINEEGLPEQTGFTTPNHYFNELEERLKTIDYDNEPAKVIPLNKNRWIYYSTVIAACLVFGLLIYPYLNKESASIPDSEITSYIENGGLTVDPQDLAQLLSDEEIDELIQEVILFTDEHLEDYLIEHLDETNLYQE